MSERETHTTAYYRNKEVGTMYYAAEFEDLTWYIMSPHGNNLRGSLCGPKIIVRTQNHYSSQIPHQNLIPLKLPHHAFIIRLLPAPYKLTRCHSIHLLFFAASSQTPLNRVYPTNFRAVIALIYLFPPIPLNFRSRCLALMDCSPCLLPLVSCHTRSTRGLCCAESKNSES